MKLQALGISALAAAILAPSAFSQSYVTSQNGLVKSMVVDPFSNPGGNEVLHYTGSFHDGVAWSLNISDLNPSDGLESAGQNPYNARFDVNGTRMNMVANELGPWNYHNSAFQNQWNESFEPIPNRSFHNAYGGYQLNTGEANAFGSGAQTYLSPTRYEFTFAAPITEVFLYIQDLDDAMLSNFNIAPEIVQTSQYRYSAHYGGDGHQKGMLVYDPTYGALKDFDGKGEGLAIGTEGLPSQFFPGNHQNEWQWNPSAAGVVRFYDPNGITSLTWDVSLLPSAIDGNSANNSDGFLFTLATPVNGIPPINNVPEPSGAILVSAAGMLLLLRRRRLD